MNKRDQRLASLALAMLLAGCASINPLAEKKQDYHDARQDRSLEVPPDLTQPQGESAYVMPAPAAQAPAAPVASAPAPTAVPQPPVVAQPTAAPAASPAPGPVTAHAVLTQTGEGAGMLLLSKPLPDAWRRVGMALEKVHATIEDRNWSQGLYYVHVAPARVPIWRFWQHRDPAAGQLWRVHLAPHGDFIAVTVLDDHGQPSDAPTASRLIRDLYQQLK